MINQNLDDWFHDPFLSIAGMRYMIPYLNRIFEVKDIKGPSCWLLVILLKGINCF